MRDGMYASGVRASADSHLSESYDPVDRCLARPSIYPIRHSIPCWKNDKGWYWYAEDVKVPTIWDAARRASQNASIYWPVSVGGQITYNLPQIWRTGTEDDLKLQRMPARPAEQELSAGLGRYQAAWRKPSRRRFERALRSPARLKQACFTLYLPDWTLSSAGPSAASQ